MSEHEEESEGGGERWLVSYADFITLLMVMFVVLYSMGQVDVKKYQQLADSFRAAFALGGPVKVVSTGVDTAGGSQTNGQSSPIEIPGIPQTPPQSEEVATELTQMLSQQNLSKEVSIQTNVEGVLISLSEKLIYLPGKSALQSDAYPVLDEIIKMVKPIPNSIRIVGHTDTTPPSEPGVTSNWELSLKRAMVISDYLIQGSIDPKRLMVAGKGEFEPLFPNDTTEHRALNSRADIVIIYNVDSNVVGLDAGSHLATPQLNQGGTP